MLDICRIIVAGTLLFGSTIHASLTQTAKSPAAMKHAAMNQAGSGRVLPRAAIEAEACRPSWPQRIPTCRA